MLHHSLSRRSALILIPVLSVLILGGCGDETVKPSELPDQGKAVLPKKSGDMGTKEKGMDRFGS